MDSVYQYAARLEQEGREFAMCTVIDAQGSSPGKTAFKMIVLPDGSQMGTVGGGTLELAVAQAAREVLTQGKSRIVSFELNPEGKDSLGMLCGGQVSVYIEYVSSRPLLYIYGAGHVGAALAAFAAMVGFEVTVMDDRPEFVTPARIPSAQHFMAGDFVELVQGAVYGPQGYHVILTDKHASDERVLRALLERGVEHKYIGMIGSKAKILEVFRHLVDAGIDSTRLAEVYAPIGIDHGGQTAEEIALAIATELVAVRHDRTLADSMRNKARLVEHLERTP